MYEIYDNQPTFSKLQAGKIQRKVTTENIMTELKTEDEGKRVKGGRGGRTLESEEQPNITAEFTSLTEATNGMISLMDEERKLENLEFYIKRKISSK